MREIADEVGAVLMVDMAHFAGLVAGKVFTGDFDPVPHAHVATTTTHKSLRGPRGGMVLCQPEFADSVDRGCPMVLGGPLGHVMAAKAVALAEARQPAFRTYAQAVADNAVALAEGLMQRGARLVTGGTENHLCLLDVSAFGLTGRQAESALLDSGIVTNRNAIPRDPNGAWYTSGVRIGTPALTSRGFGADDFDRVAELIVDVLAATSPAAAASGGASKAKYAIADGVADKTHAAAAEMLDAHPLYPGLDLGKGDRHELQPMPSAPQRPAAARRADRQRSVDRAQRVRLMFLIAALGIIGVIILFADKSTLRDEIRTRTRQEHGGDRQPGQHRGHDRRRDRDHPVGALRLACAAGPQGQELGADHDLGVRRARRAGRRLVAGATAPALSKTFSLHRRVLDVAIIVLLARKREQRVLPQAGLPVLTYRAVTYGEVACPSPSRHS